MKKLLIFHTTIAPYRVDYFNDLYCSFETRVCLQYKNLRSQTFKDYDQILKRLTFKPIYLKELVRIKGRTISCGYWKHLNDFRPDIVFVGEFGWNTIAVLLHRFFTFRKYKVVSICDDSYNMVAENNDFSFFHKTLRRYVVPCLDELILVEPQVTKWYQENYGKGFTFPIITKEEKARGTYEALLYSTRVWVDGQVRISVRGEIGRYQECGNENRSLYKTPDIICGFGYRGRRNREGKIDGTGKSVFGKSNIYRAIGRRGTSFVV